MSDKKVYLRYIEIIHFVIAHCNVDIYCNKFSAIKKLRTCILKFYIVLK